MGHDVIAESGKGVSCCRCDESRGQTRTVTRRPPQEALLQRRRSVVRAGAREGIVVERNVYFGAYFGVSV